MQRIPLIQFGAGKVGRSLIEQVIANRVRHADLSGLRLEYVALADSDGAIVDSEGLDDAALRGVLEAKSSGARLKDLDAGYVQRDPAAIVDVAGADQAIIIDVTATQATIPALLEALEQGYRVVTANKLPLVQSFALFQALTADRRTRFETTVGGSLPVVSTLQTLVNIGDEVQRIRGCLSGTLGLICAKLQAGTRFSEAVLEAQRRGYTEPNPLEDLAGRDAARKALILARMLGYPLEFEDVEVESLVPQDMDTLSIDEFLAQAVDLDAQFAARAADARAAGRPLRYVTEVAGGRCRVRMTTVDPNSRLAHIRASESIVSFETALYQGNPLTISGAGGGPAVTAAGVLGDIVVLAQQCSV
ncbi:MAG: homoserine dehydrogenase [Anaerolineae bacterium]